jgi:hypothetical protein
LASIPGKENPMPTATPDEKIETPPTPGVVATATKGSVTVKTNGHKDLVGGLKHLLGELPKLIHNLEHKDPVSTNPKS